MDIVPKPTKGKQLSKRIYISIAIAAVIIIFVIMYCLSIDYKGKYTNTAPEVVQQDTSSILAGLNKMFPNSVSKSTATQTVAQKSAQTVVKGSQPQISTGIQSLKMNDSSDDSALYNKLMEEQYKELMKACNSPLSLSDQNIQIAQGKSAASTSPAFNANTQGLLGKNLPISTYSDQNMQGEKLTFQQNASKTQDALTSGPQPQTTKLRVTAGTIIPATLLTGINSDLPGNIVAKIRQNVFDTTSGKELLIPQGSTILGVYDSQIAYGQSRVLMVWNRIIFPDGQSLDLEGMEGADLVGLAGLDDLVDNHYLRLFGSAIAMSVFSAAAQLSQQGFWNNSTPNNTPNYNAGSIMAGALGQQINQAGAKLMEKNMNIQPTINIRPGCNFNVLLTRDIPFKQEYKWGT